MSRHGKDDGYFLIDAIISLFVTTIIAAAVLTTVSVVSRRAGASFDRAITTIDARNADAEKRMGLDEKAR